MRKAAARVVQYTMTVQFGCFLVFCVSTYLEVHLAGLERSMFSDELNSDRYNHAVAMEKIYARMGLVAVFGLN